MTDPPRPRPVPLGPIDHVAVAVHDADAAIGNWVAATGHQVIGDERVLAAGVRLVYLGVPGAGPDVAVLQLVQPTTSAGTVAEHLRVHGEGLHHVCYRTASLTEALSAHGTGTETVFTGGRGLPCAFLVERPHGVLMELTQRDDQEER